MEVWTLHVGNVVSNPSYHHTDFSVISASELDEPQVNRIILSNNGDTDLFIPEGWLVEGIKQTRALTEDVVLGANSSFAVDCVCCEAGRWGLPQVSSLQRGRAPISVIAAIRSTGIPDSVEDVRTRQQNVWNSVSRQETRSGTRATNSLTQIMFEDSQSPEMNSRIQELRRMTERSRRANGVAIAVSGQPLLLDYFSDQGLFERNFAALVESVAFDIFTAEEISTDNGRIRAFIEEALGADLNYRPAVQGGARYSSHSSKLDVKVFTWGVLENELRHFLAMDLNHRSLLEV
jgi:hypothetical protein